MNRETWKRVKSVAAESWEQPEHLRLAYADRACTGDDVLHAEVRALLDAMERVGDRFETPILGDRQAGAAVSDAIASGRGAEAGERLGPWRIVREIGRGGMGTVYLGERVDGEFAQRVAIKLVRAWAGDHVLLTRFREERRILATLEHPFIARLIDGGANAGGLPYVVMEYVEGLPIDAFCDRGALDTRRRIEVFRRVCEAVHYAHQHLVVHRDIKTTNILVMPDGTPKLLDFGIAKILDAGSAERTRTLLLMATPESASPEQLRGEPITTASDVYALGVLLYRLLSGRGPYRAAPNNETELVRAVCDDEPQPLVCAREALDPDLDRITRMALRKEPERRYRTVDQFADDLKRYLDGRPVLASPDSRGYRARKFVRRHRTAVAAGLALTLAVAGGTAATMWQARLARLERLRAEGQFSAVRSLAGSVLGELHDTIEPLPGSLAARELLIRRATEYLDTLSKDPAANADLRRELALGYNRLAQVQGSGGTSNLGDRSAARRNYQRAAALFDSIDPRALAVAGRTGLAESYLRLAQFEAPGAGRDALTRKAADLVQRLEAEAPSNPAVLTIANAVWVETGNKQEAAKQYALAKASFVRVASVAETLYRDQPDNPTFSRNLSLAYKKVGTETELMGDRDSAIGWYNRAKALDQTRAAMSGSALAKLDLSFSYGAIGAALAAKHDDRGAVEQYREAVRLRREVVDADPRDDQARPALVRGYDRLSRAQARAGDFAGAIDAQMQRVATTRQGLALHAEREANWSVHASALADTADFLLTLIESGHATRSVRTVGIGQVRVVLKELGDVGQRWTNEHHTGSLPPSSDVIERLTARAKAVH